MGLAPKTAIVIKDGKEIEILIDEVQVGDIILVKPGQKIPVDGTVVKGSTAGRPEVTDIVSVGEYGENELLAIAATAEKGSEHPLGEAIVRGAEEKNLTLHSLDSFNAIPGHE